MTYSKKIYSLLIFGALLLPNVAFASTVYIDTAYTDFFVGDTVLFSVRVDSENKNINAVEGSVSLDHEAGSVSVIDLNTARSSLSLWPVNPLPSENNTSISFAGGAPGGFNSKDATIFNIVLKLQKAGPVTLTPDSVAVFLHDGKGTEDEVLVKDLTIAVLPKKPGVTPRDDWNSVLSNDTTPPESFKINAGREKSVFDGKGFLSFSTTDTQSGIAYYEVIEGDLPPVRNNGTYVLQEQNKPVKVTVIAYDSAGNAREATYVSRQYPLALPVAIGIIVIILVFILVRYRKRRASSSK